MKTAVLVTTALLLAAPALAADPVSLLGTWKGEEAGVGAKDGWDRHDLLRGGARAAGRGIQGDEVLWRPRRL